MASKNSNQPYISLYLPKNDAKDLAVIMAACGEFNRSAALRRILRAAIVAGGIPELEVLAKRSSNTGA